MYGPLQPARIAPWKDPALMVFALGVALALVKGFAYTPASGTWGGLADCASVLTALAGVLLLVALGSARSNLRVWWGSLALIAAGTAGLLGWVAAAAVLVLLGVLTLAVSSYRGIAHVTPSREQPASRFLPLGTAGIHTARVYRALAALLVVEIWKEATAPHRAAGNMLELGAAATLLSVVGVLGAGLAAARLPDEPEWARGSLRSGRSPYSGWIAAGCFTLFLLIGGLIHLEPVQRADVAWVHAFFHSGGHSLTHLMSRISDIGGRDLAVYWIPAVFIGLLSFRRRREACFFAPVMFGTVGLELFFKTLTHRARPEFGGKAHWDSFPSGHTLAATLFAITLLVLLLPLCRRHWQKALLWTGAVVWPIMMAMSRVYLGRHYVTDVTAALLLGVAWVLGCQALYVWSFRRARAAL